MARAARYRTGRPVPATHVSAPVHLLPKLAAGLTLSVFGVAMIVAMATVAYGATAVLSRWALLLGLTGVLIGSALGQLLLLFGGWLIWSALRERYSA